MKPENKINNDKNGIALINSNEPTAESMKRHGTIRDIIIFENKYNEKISFRSDTSSIEPVYKESEFNVKHWKYNFLVNINYLL